MKELSLAFFFLMNLHSREQGQIKELFWTCVNLNMRTEAGNFFELKKMMNKYYKLTFSVVLISFLNFKRRFNKK